MREGYLSDSAVLERCVQMQSVPLGRPDLAVRVGNKTIYPQNAAMMYANLPVDAQRKLDLVSDFVDRARAQPQAIPPIATAIPPVPAVVPPPLSEDDYSETDVTKDDSPLGDDEGDGFSTPPQETSRRGESSRIIPEDNPMVPPPAERASRRARLVRPLSFSPSVYQPFDRPAFLPPHYQLQPRSPDANEPTGDSPTGREREEIGRQGRNILLDRRNSPFAEAVRSRVSSGFATLQNVLTPDRRTAPSSRPQQELSQESQPRPSPLLGSRLAIRTIPFGS